MSTNEEQEYHEAIHILIYGGLLTYVTRLMLKEFQSPSWKLLYQQALSEFRHMGLEENSLDQFQYPDYESDSLFDGYPFIWGHEYYIIREWFLPGWQMLMQPVFLLGSYLSQMIFDLPLIPWPDDFILMLLYGIAFIWDALADYKDFICLAI